MIPILFSLFLNALLIFLMLALVQRKQIFEQPLLLVLFFGVYFLDNLIITVTNHFPRLQIIPNHIWEGFLICSWSGKLYSILFAVALVFWSHSSFTKESIGFTFRQKQGSLLPTCVIIVSLVSWAVFVGFCSSKGRLDFSTLLYLAVMPALNEELIYRGYLLAILNRLLPRSVQLFAAPIGWGVMITSMLFGLLHGVWLDGSLALHINVIAIRNSTISGFIFAWLRQRTDSLVMPMIAHGIEDVLFFLPRMIQI